MKYLLCTPDGAEFFSNRTDLLKAYSNDFAYKAYEFVDDKYLAIYLNNLPMQDIINKQAREFFVLVVKFDKRVFYVSRLPEGHYALLDQALQAMKFQSEKLAREFLNENISSEKFYVPLEYITNIHPQLVLIY